MMIVTGAVEGVPAGATGVPLPADTHCVDAAAVISERTPGIAPVADGSAGGVALEAVGDVIAAADGAEAATAVGVGAEPDPLGTVSGPAA
ncbi:MAG: hypothetical protein ACRC33_04680 [Gemmataceae bacterium]